MVVIISNDVWSTIDEYADALTRYPISSSRAHEKVDNLIAALEDLGDSIASPPICMWKDLLQSFDNKGTPIDKNLKRFNYKDESEFQWAFACHYDYENNTITILKMMAASHVKECINPYLQRILEFNERLMSVI